MIIRLGPRSSDLLGRSLSDRTSATTPRLFKIAALALALVTSDEGYSTAHALQALPDTDVILREHLRCYDAQTRDNQRRLQTF